MGLNLHGIVRGAIHSVNRDLKCSLFRSTGKNKKDERGIPTPLFSTAEDVTAQFQSAGTDAIQYVDGIEKLSNVRKVYLFASSDPSKRPWSIYRPLARVGDYIKDPVKRLWRVNAITEDFSNEGWICVIATMDTTTRELLIEEDDESN